MEAHERGMRLAIAQAMKNPRFPFGAVILRAGTEQVLGSGVDDARSNPVLYSTAEPCTMCISALVWAGIGGVVFASSLAIVNRWGRGKYGIDITARAVVEAAHGYGGTLLGGVLAAETDALFARPLGD